MFSNTVAASMSRDLKPYIGYSGSANTAWKLDTATTTDAGTAFQAYVITKAYAPGGPKNCFIHRSYLLAKAASGVTIRQTLTADFGTNSTFDDALLTPAGSETWVSPRFEDSRLADFNYVQIKWGDSAAVASAWQLDDASLEYFPREVA